MARIMHKTRLTGLALSLCICTLWETPVFGQATITIDSPDRVTRSLVDGRILVGPDPTNLAQLFGLLAKPEVVSALNLSPTQMETLQSFIESEKSRLQSATNAISKNRNAVRELVPQLREERVAIVEELLTPDQRKRLTQIAYRVEVSTRGIASALTEGRLRDKAGIIEGQFPNIILKWERIEASAKQKIKLIMEQAEDELLAELGAEQRALIKDALGEHFLYENVEGMSSSLRTLITQQDAKEHQKDRKTTRPTK